MKIDIQARGLPLTPALDAYVRRRLYMALSTRGDSIRLIEARLSGDTGPGGGREKRCRLKVALPGHPEVTIENSEPDLYVAIHRATDRAGWKVRRLIDRQRRQVRARLLAAREDAARSRPAAPSF